MSIHHSLTGWACPHGGGLASNVGVGARNVAWTARFHDVGKGLFCY